jgi:hypothetical protein
MDEPGLRKREAGPATAPHRSPEDKAFIAAHGRLRRSIDHVAFDPFRRKHDGKLTWRDHAKSVAGIVLVPFRISLAMALMGAPYFLVVVFGPPMKDVDEPNEEIIDLPAWRRRICAFAMRFCGRGLLFCLGFWRVFATIVSMFDFCPASLFLLSDLSYVVCIYSSSVVPSSTASLRCMADITKTMCVRPVPLAIMLSREVFLRIVLVSNHSMLLPLNDSGCQGGTKCHANQ